MAELAGESAPLDVVFNPKRTARDAEFAALSDEVARAFQVIRASFSAQHGRPEGARRVTARRRRGVRR
jgi:hypothetical protein